MCKVNKYVLNGIDKEKLSPSIKNNLKSLIGYLHTYRFNYQINSFSNIPMDETEFRTFLLSPSLRFSFYSMHLFLSGREKEGKGE